MTARNSSLLNDQGDEVQTLVSEVRKLASKNEIRALARELESHKAAIKLCARVAVVDLVSG